MNRYQNVCYCALMDRKMVVFLFVCLFVFVFDVKTVN